MMKPMWLAVCCLCAACPPESDETGTLPPANLRTEAGYTLATRIDVTAASLLPESASSYLEKLRLLRDDPGEAFFVVLDEAGVPLVAELRAALPDAIEGKLKGWIRDAMPAEVNAHLDILLGAADQALAGFDLVSTLDLPAYDEGGFSAATHTATALRFGDVEVVVPRVDTVTSVPVDAVLSRGSAPSSAHLDLGPHGFSLAYGERIFDLLEARSPGGLRARLGELVDCPAVAAEVAARCFLDVCVGHATELTALCERGLDEVIVAARKKLAELRFDALRFEHGTGELLESSGDGLVDTVSGSWTCQANLGMGLRPVNASFAGVRD